MAAQEYYQSSPHSPPSHPYQQHQQSIHLTPQATGESQTWTPEPPKSPWERPQHIHQAPEPVYQTQPHPGYYNTQGDGKMGQGGGGPQTHVVVVKQGSRKEDAAMGCCAGCLGACLCCGCCVM